MRRRAGERQGVKVIWEERGGENHLNIGDVEERRSKVRNEVTN